MWQFPNRTEQAVAERHASARERYLAQPWAAMIDAGRVGEILSRPEFPAATPSDRHTVCQHVHWRQLVPVWEKLGVTDVWLSHAAEPGYPPDAPPAAATEIPAALGLHAWPLFAVNVEDPERRAGMESGKDPRARRYLASFIGAHSPNYISDTRLRLEEHREHPNFFIRLTGDRWHFHDVVWEHQVKGRPIGEVYRIDESVTIYNRVLSDSVFALCPAGSGRNTIRLWEALAVGAIPVLLDEPPLFPSGGSLPDIDWSRIVLQLTPDDMPNLPLILRRMPSEQILDRHHRALAAYQVVKTMTCF